MEMENQEKNTVWPYDPYSKIQVIINKVNWAEEKFSIKKAYLCSIFSEIAYWNIPQYELDTDKRVRVIPCETYQKIHQAKILNVVSSIFRNQDLYQIHSINRYFASTTIIRTPKVIIVAIRGTQNLYDWYVNLKIAKYAYDKNNNIKFHKGFYKAIHTSFEEINEKLKEWSEEHKLPIYITGHSLGGAMASIYNGIWSSNYRFSDWNEGYSHLKPHSCYAFGMPRYCNLSGITYLKNPFHIYNPMDIVAVVPPRWMGYEDCSNEFRLNGQEIENISIYENYKNIKWLSKLMLIKRIREHSIELYRDSIEKQVLSKQYKGGNFSTS